MLKLILRELHAIKNLIKKIQSIHITNETVVIT